MSRSYCMSPNFVYRNSYWDKNASNIEQHITHFIISFIVPGSESHLQTALTLLTKLQNVTSDRNPGLCSCFPHINATLNKLLLTCNAACTVQVSTDNVSFNNNHRVKRWNYSHDFQSLLIYLDIRHKRIIYNIAIKCTYLHTCI